MLELKLRPDPNTTIRSGVAITQTTTTSSGPVDPPDSGTAAAKAADDALKSYFTEHKTSSERIADNMATGKYADEQALTDAQKKSDSIRYIGGGSGKISDPKAFKEFYNIPEKLPVDTNTRLIRLTNPDNPDETVGYLSMHEESVGTTNARDRFDANKDGLVLYDKDGNEVKNYETLLHANPELRASYDDTVAMLGMFKDMGIDKY